MKTKKDSGFSQGSAMADLLASSSNNKIPSLKRNQEVVGKVVMVSPSEILVDIGAKSEGIISGRELSAIGDVGKNISVGDSIEATVLYPENDAGQVVLTLRKLSGEKRWQELEERKKSGEEVEVVGYEANRGGIICDFLGLRGFLPSSQLAKATSKLEDLVNKTLSVKVIEVDRISNRLIFSQKGANKKDLGDLVKLLAKVKIGDKYTGVVTAILPFGVFVEIEIGSVGKLAGRQVGEKEPTDLQTHEPKNQKLEGLVHISEISWEKVDDVSKIYKVGDEVDVLVIAKDAANGRLNLSVRQLTEDPFAEEAKKYTKEMIVKGVVSRVTPYGVFVTLNDGMEGLIHISKIPPNMVYTEG
ncbi:MAG TPA: S1 RNA-binding domain-containing protein, partial [Candidatus Saccharimonadales bacterium]|nr:S1 RNA-binding domain-containing protein [Candidatus Saccharimonadales bacterium]